MRIIFFDGHCNLCNNFVDWLIKKDSESIFLYSSLQGKKIQEVKLPDNLRGQDSIVYFRHGVYFIRSQAVVNILEDLGGIYSIAAFFINLMPKRIADWGYSIVARFRYKIFGMRDTCRIPTSEERKKFLD